MTATRPQLDLDAVLSAPEPWAALAAERERGWITESPLGLHVMTFDAAFDLLRDRRFDTDAGALLDGAGITDAGIRSLWRSALLGSEPGDHDRLRILVAPYFTRRAATELRPYVAELTGRLAAPLAARGTFDAVTELTSRIPPSVFARMIGAPEADADRIGAWSTTILQIFARRPDLASAIEAATHELLGYVDAFIETRRREPGGTDMISSLLAANNDGDRLSDHELRALALEALEASTDNTASALATVLYAGARHPEHWRALAREPELIPGFVEEVARLWPRITHIIRVGRHDAVWREISIAAGTPMLVAVPSALRDPAVFDDPDRFDPTRDHPGSRNLNFGSGAHHCIGAALARMELVAVVEVLAARWPRLELAGEPTFDTNVGVTTVAHLPLVVTDEP